MIEVKKIFILEEMPTEVQMLVEYKMAVNRLQQTVKETTKKHSLPNINYRYFWNLELETHKAYKKLRGW